MDGKYRLLNEKPKGLENVRHKIMYGIFQVFENGRIFKIKGNKKIECTYTLDKKGYKIVTANINGKQKHFRVHILVATAFLPNPENKQHVIFKDKNKENIHVNNLQWVTKQELIQSWYKEGKIDPYTNGKKCKLCNRKTRRKEGICPSCRNKLEKEKKKEQRKQAIRNSVAHLMNQKELFTKKQQEILKLRFEGLEIKEIAKIKGISRQAVEKTLKRIYLKYEEK